MPAGVAVPTVVPPEAQFVGADDWGPKTVKVMVLVSLVPEEPLRVAVSELAGIAAATLAETGAATLSVGDAAPTTVSDIPEPQGDAAALLLPSPPYDAYHQ